MDFKLTPKNKNYQTPGMPESISDFVLKFWEHNWIPDSQLDSYKEDQKRDELMKDVQIIIPKKFKTGFLMST